MRTMAMTGIYMGMEGGEGEDGWEDDGMDVDGADTPKKKKAKRNDGAVAVVAAGGRGPRTDRRLAGMRDEGVSISLEGI
jgi:nucleolar GTP-binding protein